MMPTLPTYEETIWAPCKEEITGCEGLMLTELIVIIYVKPQTPQSLAEHTAALSDVSPEDLTST